MRFKTHIFNATNMPQAGAYILERMDQTSFADAIREAARAGRIVSSLGYQINAEIIADLTGISLPLNVRRIELMDGDEILAMRLKYDPKSKPGQRDITGPECFEFFRARYYEALPILPRAVVANLDPEPIELEFLKRYLQIAYAADRDLLDITDSAWERHSETEPEDQSAAGWEAWEAENDRKRAGFWNLVEYWLRTRR
jgi:hypothetical protein